MVQKKGMERISENMNRTGKDLKLALITASLDYEAVTKALNEKQKSKEKDDKPINQSIDMNDIKNAPKIIMDER